MSVQTTADEHFQETKEHLNGARLAILKILAGEWGTEEYQEPYLFDILSAIRAAQMTIGRGPQNGQ